MTIQRNSGYRCVLCLNMLVADWLKQCCAVRVVSQTQSQGCYRAHRAGILAEFDKKPIELIQLAPASNCVAFTARMHIHQSERPTSLWAQRALRALIPRIARKDLAYIKSFMYLVGLVSTGFVFRLTLTHWYRCFRLVSEVSETSSPSGSFSVSVSVSLRSSDIPASPPPPSLKLKAGVNVISSHLLLSNSLMAPFIAGC